MESYIRISNINDFLYSPRSLYLHGIYEIFADAQYKAEPQVRGAIVHKSIEEGTYSSSKRYLTGLSVFSGSLGVAGKIDIYDRERYALIERKSHIKKIYEGMFLQLYAQCIAMREGGYEVRQLFLHSLADNVRYAVPLPKQKELKRLRAVLEAMRLYDITQQTEQKDELSRCNESIYGALSY